MKKFYNPCLLGVFLLWMVLIGFEKWNLLILGLVGFIQNIFFTWVSRSRNSGDPNYHRFAACGSSGVWFVCQIFIVKNIWMAIHNGDWIAAILAGLVYTLCTTEGSVCMMKYLIKTESGKRKVGHYPANYSKK